MPKNPTKDSGYSEEEQAKIIEGTNQDTKQIGNKRKPLSTISRQEKIMYAYQELTDSTAHLIQSLAQIHGNERQTDLVMDEIKRLRILQDELLQMLLLEQRGELSEKTVSKEAWNLIQ